MDLMKMRMKVASLQLIMKLKGFKGITKLNYFFFSPKVQFATQINEFLESGWLI